jgi:hypothetical protein
VCISWLSLKTKIYGLSEVWPQNHWDDFLWFGLKTGGSSFPVWASKPAAPFGDFGPQNHRDGFWFGPQNQAGFGLSVVSQN